MTGLSLKDLEVEKQELQKDLVAFKTAYDNIRQRLVEASEAVPSRGHAMERWAGTWACIGSLDLTIQMVEKQIGEVEHHIQQILSGEIPNTDVPTRPGLSVIDGGMQ